MKLSPPLRPHVSIWAPAPNQSPRLRYFLAFACLGLIGALLGATVVGRALLRLVQSTNIEPVGLLPGIIDFATLVRAEGFFWAPLFFLAVLGRPQGVPTRSVLAAAALSLGLVSARSGLSAALGFAGFFLGPALAAGLLSAGLGRAYEWGAEDRLEAEVAGLMVLIPLGAVAWCVLANASIPYCCFVNNVG